MLLTATYITYIILSVFITIYVAYTLSKNGIAFLIDGFGGDEELARSINHMLVVGFYLINLGFVLLKMRTNVLIQNVDQMIVYLSSNIGFVLFILGLAHFFNLYMINKFRQGHIKRIKADKKENEVNI